MQKRRIASSIAMSAVIFCLSVDQALAWGDTGHRLIGEAAMRGLSPGLPSFLYTEAAIADVGQYSREPDLWRKAGGVHDSDRDPAHLIKLNDDGTTLGGDTLDTLPATRSLYEATLRAHGADPAVVGYLPYSLIDAYQQVAKDFALIRVIGLAQARDKNTSHQAWLKAAYRRRTDLTLRDIGILSHYVGDATQPMHLSVHYDGWGSFPNPEGFTTASIHWPIEGSFVRQSVTLSSIRAAMTSPAMCEFDVRICVINRLKRNFKQVIPLYALEKSGGFTPGDPRGRAYVTGLVAQGASDLRDMVSDAWQESAKVPVSFSGLTYEDARSGKIPDLYALLYGES